MKSAKFFYLENFRLYGRHCYEVMLAYHHTYNCAHQTKLEAVGKKGSSLEEDKQQLQTECDAAKRQLEELQEKHSKVCEHTHTK